MSSHDIANDSELRQSVRNLTGYADNSDELPQTELDGIINAQKLRIEAKYGTTSWYSDNGVTLMLLGLTCMFAKAQVENYSLSSYSMGDQQVTVQDADPEDSSQFQLWADMVSDGLEASSTVTASRVPFKNTSDYIG